MEALYPREGGCWKGEMGVCEWVESILFEVKERKNEGKDSWKGTGKVVNI